MPGWFVDDALYICLSMSDILGQAISDHFYGKRKNKLWIHNHYGPKEEMPVATFFRDDDDMPDLEWLALNECRGRVLDIGAAAGSHALLLQQKGTIVTALDISPLAVEVMLARGVEKVVEADIFAFSGEKFDTILLLMNGIGLAGTIDSLEKLLLQLKALLADGGQILFDSSDVAYLYEGKLPEEKYHGEIWYQYEYKKQKTEWFPWLYVDEATMTGIATRSGFKTEVLLEDEFGQYLAQLKML